MSEISEIVKALTEFRNDRDWEQFHNSKDLSIAIMLEAAELNELFLWKDKSEVDNVNIAKLKEELADVFAFSFLLAAKHDLDVKEIVLEKIKQNNAKYPIEKAKGTAKKYNEL